LLSVDLARSTASRQSVDDLSLGLPDGTGSIFRWIKLSNRTQEAIGELSADSQSRD
jgi:hypothetical protein